MARGGKAGNGRETTSPGYCEWTRSGSTTNGPSARSSSFGRPNTTGLYFGSWRIWCGVRRVGVGPYKRRSISTFYAGPGGRRTGKRDVRPKWETICQSLNDHASPTWGVTWDKWVYASSAQMNIMSNQKVCVSGDFYGNADGRVRIFRGEECRGGSMNSKWHDNVQCTCWYNIKNSDERMCN